MALLRDFRKVAMIPPQLLLFYYKSPFLLAINEIVGWLKSSSFMGRGRRARENPQANEGIPDCPEERVDFIL